MTAKVGQRTSPLFQVDEVYLFPDHAVPLEIAKLIFAHLSASILTNVRGVNKAWLKAVVAERSLWDLANQPKDPLRSLKDVVPCLIHNYRASEARAFGRSDNFLQEYFCANLGGPYPFVDVPTRRQLRSTIGGDSSPEESDDEGVSEPFSAMVTAYDYSGIAFESKF